VEVHAWEKTEKREAGFMVIVNEIEAIQLAENLLQQIRLRSSNHGRLELTTRSGEYFSIAVHTDKDKNDLFWSKPII